MKSSSVSKGGVMIPKKLQQDYGDSSDQIQYILEQGRKIDEILTYLQAKEEASKGEYLMAKPGEMACEVCIGKADRYFRDKDGLKRWHCKEHMPKNNPPEHEESDGEFYGIHQSAGSWYREFENGKGRPLKIQDLKELFVSKEKIKREIEKAADCAPGTRGRTLDAISKSLGLGD